MKKILFIVVIIFHVSISLSQDAQKEIDEVNCGGDYELAFTNPEIKPIYKSGLTGLLNDIVTNLKYPITKNCISGKVYINFKIDSLGNTSNFKIAKGLSEEFNIEALRVAKLLDKWIPGSLNGKKVSYNYTIPIIFNNRLKAVFLSIHQNDYFCRSKIKIL